MNPWVIQAFPFAVYTTGRHSCFLKQRGRLYFLMINKRRLSEPSMFAQNKTVTRSFETLRPEQGSPLIARVRSGSSRPPSRGRRSRAYLGRRVSRLRPSAAAQLPQPLATQGGKGREKDA
ncbi:unnamed protein product, partial [Ixodes pacificus]